jgi:hypothetical protein
MSSAEERLAQVKPSQRILLLPHCLRNTETCQNKYSQQGLECMECTPDCAVNRLRQTALSLGYKGTCVAPGGRLAVKYVHDTRPRGIVAVACFKELEEGVHGVQDLSGGDGQSPVIVIIPLSKDGCVDTEVDIDQAIEILALGCSRPAVRGETG